MSNKCAYCGGSLEESQFEYKENTLCSEVCYNEMKFVIKGGDMVILVIGFLSLGIMFLTVALLIMYAKTCFTGFVIVEKLTPYLITSLFILLLSIITAANGQSPFDKPFRSITKVFSKYGIPYWIIAINYIYIYTYVAILLGGGNLGEDIIQDSVNIWGLKFNYFVANSLMFLSFVSLLTLVIRVRNKFID
jgi:hypothetical protein